MLARARAREIYERLDVADVAATGLDGAAYDLVTTCLVDEHLADLRPLYREVSRLARPGGLHVLVGFHPYFIMRAGMATHFDRRPGEPIAIETYVHLLSDHVGAARAAGLTLIEMRERLIDDRWIALKPRCGVPPSPGELRDGVAPGVIAARPRAGPTADREAAGGAGRRTG